MKAEKKRDSNRDKHMTQNFHPGPSGASKKTKFVLRSRRSEHMALCNIDGAQVLVSRCAVIAPQPFLWHLKLIARLSPVNSGRKRFKGNKHVMLQRNVMRKSSGENWGGKIGKHDQLVCCVCINKCVVLVWGKKRMQGRSND